MSCVACAQADAMTDLDEVYAGRVQRGCDVCRILRTELKVDYI
jgi:hypothetical protein